MVNNLPINPELKGRLVNFIARLSPAERSHIQRRYSDTSPVLCDTGLIRRRECLESSLPSFAQLRLWFLDQLNPGSSLYNISTAVRIGGPLNVRVLEQSLNAIVARHESLRTTFADREGMPIQVVDPSLVLAVPVVDLSNLPEIERETKLKIELNKQSHQPFDLLRGPLIRATLFYLGKHDYALLLVLHHIISDGWSMGVLFHEVALIYQAFSTGQPSPLPDLRIQYADFALWQREWLQGEMLEKQLAYWKQQLKGAPALLELTGDRPRPVVQTFCGARQPIILSKSLSASLKELSRNEGVTLFMTLIAAFQALLARYAGQDDIVVGSAVAGRSQPGTEMLIGNFLNTLILRTNLSGNPTFRELLRRVREVALGAYAHQDVPFERLVEELRPRRSLSHNPVFQVMIALENARQSTLNLSGLELTRLEIDDTRAKFDLTLFLIESSEGMHGALQYNSELFEATMMTRMVDDFQALLKGIIANPDRQLLEMPVSIDTKSQPTIHDWNNTQTAWGETKYLKELFEDQVERTPDAVAVVHKEVRLSYRELNSRANRLAHYLRKLGVGPEVLVAVMIERSPDMVVGLLGILKAGGAYVPLDPAYPMEHLSSIMRDAQVSVLVTKEPLSHYLPTQTTKVIYLDRDWEMIGHESPQNIGSRIEERNLAYVIYTSGSTGKPKGVAIEHRSAAALLYWSKEVFSPEQLCGVLASTSICFDLSIFELFVPLSWGGTTILADDALQLPILPSAQEVTLMNSVPSAIAELIRIKGIPASVRTVNSAGEPLRQDLVERLYQEKGIQEIYNLYGPTEATVYSTFALMKRVALGPPPIGRPISGTEIYILDENLRPVSVGVAGELYIGGAGVARGYLNSPHLTAERFIPHPFTSQAGERLYKTGDWARYLSSGEIEYLARIDNQVKIRGRRIELSEIEAVLSEHPAVRANIVKAREDEIGEKRLVAFIVFDKDPRPSVSQVRNYLKQRLPEHTVPSTFVILDALPLMPNGKIDHRDLPTDLSMRPDLDDDYIAPRTLTEQKLAQIWAEALGLERVGIHDNFFELGGHSLVAAQVISRMRSAFRVEITPACVFDEPTIAKLGLIVMSKQLDRIDREQLLAELDQLTASEVDSLLSYTVAEIGGSLNEDHP